MANMAMQISRLVHLISVTIHIFCVLSQATRYESSSRSESESKTDSPGTPHRVEGSPLAM
jgi:hypothetical protein